MKLSPTATRRLIIVGLLIVWELLPRAGLIPPLFLPPLSRTLIVGLANWREYSQHFIVTLREIGIAGVIASTLGVFFGALIGSVASLRALILPLASSFYAIPLIVIYPVIAAWLGIGTTSKICFAAVYGFLPTVLSTAAGIQTIPPQLLTAADSMGASTLQKIVRVMIPAAIPSVLSGLRLGGALVIVGVVVTEMLSSAAGIGYLITLYRTLLDTPQVFFAILLVLAITVLFDTVMRLLERRTAVWQTAGRTARLQN